MGGAALAWRRAESRKTNFVFILADDFGWRDLACYGNPCKSPKVRNVWLAGSLRKRKDHVMVYI
jgi:hypothetical protein